MGITTTKVLKLTFNTNGGRTFVLTIPDPKGDLQNTDIEALMDEIVLKNVFITPSGALSGKKDARIIDTTINDMFDPPKV